MHEMNEREMEQAMRSYDKWLTEWQGRPISDLAECAMQEADEDEMTHYTRFLLMMMADQLRRLPFGSVVEPFPDFEQN